MTGRGWVEVAGIHINRAALSRRQNYQLAALRLLLAPLMLLGLMGTFEFSRSGAQFALDIVTGRNAGPGARTIYIALLTAAPVDSSTVASMTEATMTGYARQSVAWTAPTNADPPETHNSGVITYGPVTGSMQTVSHFAVVSSSSGTGGDFCAWGALTNARTPVSGDSLQAAAAAFSLTAT